MERMAALLLGIALLICSAYAGETALPTEDALRTVTVCGEKYRLGADTPAAFARQGWTCEVEPDGVYAFYDAENASWFYARTADGSPDAPIVTLNFLWADGVAVEYLGLAPEALWDGLARLFPTVADEEGALTAQVPLSGGETLMIETKGGRLRLSLAQ